MNGRVYDPLTAQFLSPDPFIQSPGDWLNYNRYSYCFGNPLKYTDPSGNVAGVDDAIFIGLSIAMVIRAGINGGMNAYANNSNVAIGAFGGVMMTGMPMFLTGMITAGATAGIGDIFGHELESLGTELLRAGTHGTFNGMMTLVQGGDFWQGFAVGAVSSLAGSGMQAAGLDAALLPLGTGLAGAGTAALTGGDAFAGFMAGYGIGKFNHKGEKLYDQNGKFIGIASCEDAVVIGKMPAKFKGIPWMLVAKGQLGQTEKKPGNNSSIVAYHSTTGKFKNDETPWCSSFVNWSFTEVGINGTNSARAYSWNNWGQTLTKPAYGAVAVMNYSHVGFVEGINNDGRLILLGGNQGKPGAVNYSPNSFNSVVTYRYPIGYVPNYNLPTYNISGRSLNLSSTR